MPKTPTQFTKDAFADDLITLLKTKPFQRITIRTICEHAHLSRTTFYQHFTDKFDLALYCYERFDKQVTEHSPYTPFDVYLENLLAAVYRNRKILRNLFLDSDGLLMKSKIYTRFVESTTEYYKKKPEEKLHGLPPKIVSIYFASGFLAFINWWIESNFEIDQKTMETYIHTMHENNPYI